VVICSDSRKLAEKHNIHEMHVQHGARLPDTPVMALHRGRIDLEAHPRRDPKAQKELARLLYVEQPTMAQLLTGMERDGLIERTPEPSHFILTEHGWQTPMMLGKWDGIGQIGSPERLDEQEPPQSRSLSLDGARRELAIAKQVNLILANLVWPQLIWRPAEIPGELADRMNGGPHGVQRGVATLELIQYHLAKMDHREPPCDSNLSRT
jgi:hypothetical protein